MKIATFNVNGVKGRLPRLLEWLDETRPDVACLQEIKTGDATFPRRGDRGGRLSRRSGTGSRAHHGVAILARGATPREVRRGLPGDDARLPGALPRGRRARAAHRVGLPAQRQPAARPEVRLQAGVVRAPDRARADAASTPGVDVVLAGDFNVVPTNADIYNAWLLALRRGAAAGDARGVRDGCSRRAGSTRRGTCIPNERIYTFWVNAERSGATPAFAWTSCC